MYMCIKVKIYTFSFGIVHFVHFQFSENPDNQSLSVLTYTPAIDDDGKYLTCRAENPHIENSAIEDKWSLVVYCKYLLQKRKIILIISEYVA